MTVSECGTAEISDRNYRKVIRAWAMYDWANSAFATTIIAAVLPVFYSNVAAATVPRETASRYFGYTNSVAMLFVALLAPLLGAIADHSRSRKRFLGAFVLLGVTATAFMPAIGRGEWLLASSLYVVGHLGFAGANVFYDSLLPHISRPQDIHRVSARGFAMGYLGGGLLLAVNLIMIEPRVVGLRSFPGIPNAEWGTRFSFLTVAVWWAVFSLPLFRCVPEPPAAPSDGDTSNSICAGFRRLGQTFRNLRRYRELFKFLLAFWLYSDGIGTIFRMAAIFGKEIGISDGHLVGALLAVQFVGIPFAIAFGRLTRLLGTKPSILLALVGYAGISICGYFMQTALHFWLLALAVAVVQGGSQALSRSMFAGMSPKAKTAEFFGFYDVSSKFAGIIGPFLFGVVGTLTGSSRLSIVSLVVFFVVGAILLMTVNEDEGMRIARAEDAALAVLPAEHGRE